MSDVGIWMPLYCADYLADTSRLTLEQHGAYLIIIMDYWRNGPLPDEDGTIARILGITPDAWRALAPAVLQFFRHDSGHLRHKRIDEELAKAKAKKAAAVDKAQKAAGARWRKQAPSNAPSIPQALLEQCPSPSPSPSPSPQPIELAPFSKKALEKGERRAPRDRSLPCPYDTLVDLYHELLPNNPRVSTLSEPRKRRMRARWIEWSKRKKYGTPSTVEAGIAFWRRFFEFSQTAAFLTGRVRGRDGRDPHFADIDFLMGTETHYKVVEGKYHEGRDAA